MRFKFPGFLSGPAMQRLGVPAALIAIFLAQWALLFPSSGPSWDAAVYYAYARSLVFDRDLRIANDLQLSYPTAAPDFAAARLDQEQTGTGRVAGPFAIGSALLWLPWLALLRLLSWLGQLTGLLPGQLTGFEWYFSLAVATLSMMLGWLAFWIAYRLALEVSHVSSALLATLSLLFATPLLYYLYAEALFAHGTATFISALFVFAWWRGFRMPVSKTRALATGALLGLAILVRWQQAIYLVLPLSTIGIWWLSFSAGERRRQLRPALVTAAFVVLGAALLFAPQLAHWRIQYGDWITIPQGAGFMDWRAPHWRHVLFSSFKGLLPWMPVFFLSLAGLLVQARKKPEFIVPLLIVMVLALYISSSTNDWFGGGGYGPRRFTSELAILVIGYAGLLQALPFKARLVAGGLAAFVLLIQQWILLRFGLAEAMGGRVLTMAPTYTWSESGYPAFFGRLVAHLPDLAARPAELLFWPDSPLGSVVNGRFPANRLLALVATAAFLAALWLLAGRLHGRLWQRSPAARRAALAILIVVPLAASLWIVLWA